jgi:hypothetical protein
MISLRLGYADSGFNRGEVIAEVPTLSVKVADLIPGNPPELLIMLTFPNPSDCPSLTWLSVGDPLPKSVESGCGYFFMPVDLNSDDADDILIFKNFSSAWKRNNLLESPANPQTPDFVFEGFTIGEPFVRSMNYGDLDGDGDIDLASVRADGHFWLENLGGGEVPPFLLQPLPFIDPNPISDKALIPQAVSILPPPDPPNPTSGLPAFDETVYPFFDVNGDSFPDIVIQGLDGITWYENENTIPLSFTRHFQPLPVSGFSYASQIEDVNGDGSLDLLIKQGYVVHSDGSNPTFQVIPLPFLPEDFDWSFADLDFDGDLDFFFVDDLQWWENDGQNPPTFTMHLIDDDFSIQSATSADLNGDSYPEIIVGTRTGIFPTLGKIIIYDNQLNSESSANSFWSALQ